MSKEPPTTDGTIDRSRRRFVGRTLGIAAAVAALPAATGVATAHFPNELEIDVRPGSDRNPVNPRSRGVIPVAVLGTESFDPTSEDVRYRFGAPDVVTEGGGARPVHGGHVEDANGDGRDDLVLHFRANETGFDGDESAGRLEWESDESGAHGTSGTDDVTIVGPP